ncbi:C2H2-type domain-containing protein [Mycena indigotica]|uniref:C2H2-type domain-containing protein n=1 Tax=Mycena indigotica TaxID=2126181 RepID=A0A8H6VUA9_9AGAR|nr:C2H2-type domain-containing protein [Mycena indigotica]KAF7292216.1 C2H2-type domain-containing protein [Mycena indigotica]
MPRASKPKSPRRGNRKTIPDLPCQFPGCGRTFKTASGLTRHVRAYHDNPTEIAGPSTMPFDNPSPSNGSSSQPSPLRDSPMPAWEPHSSTPPASVAEGNGPENHWRRIYHPFLTGRPCDENGVYLPAGEPPQPRHDLALDEWDPYEDLVQFRLADFAFRKAQISGSNIDELLEIWALDKLKSDEPAPFANADHLYETIDATTLGDAPWKCLVTDPVSTAADAPEWARRSYEIWYRDPKVVVKNLLDNPDFNGLFDYAPYIEINPENKRRWSDFMSANFAWSHSDEIYKADNSTAGSDDLPAVLLARTRRLSRCPPAMSNTIQGDRKYDNDPAFRTFKRQLYHASWAAVLSSLKPGMTNPVVRRCPDGHFRRVIYDFGPFIADYPEQVLLAGIVQGWCTKCTAPAHDLDGSISTARTYESTEELITAFDGDAKTLWENYGINTDVIPFTTEFLRADIHEMLSPDLLHQLIKGTFKDHLVEWVGEYLSLTHEKAEAEKILDEIDRRIAAVPAFGGLRRFKQGRRFKQWTGDDSKALMKVYLPALKGLVPPEIIQTLSSFLDFCYLVRRQDFDEDTLDSIDAAVSTFHKRREFFRTAGVRPEGFSLPRQHSILHYCWDIKRFGAPYGVCSSITESRHITAVKKPWRCSSRFEALGQMLLTNQRLDKLAAARVDFEERGMLRPQFPALPDKINVDDDADEEAIDGPRVEGAVVLARTRERSYPSDPVDLGVHINVPQLSDLLRTYLNLDANANLDDIEHLSVFHSATASFYSPSDPSGIRGMKRERIRCTPSWRKHGPRRDCAFIVEDDAPGFSGMSVVRIRLLFSFTYNGVYHPCALVRWFKKVGTRPDPETGMWIVEPDIRYGSHFITIEHLDTILCAAHLIPVFGERNIPHDLRYTDSLDSFLSFHVNKYIDAHANEIAF